MMVTYCENTDIALINGKAIINYIDKGVTLSTAEIDAILDAAREAAYNSINENHLRGRTAIPTDPASPHIASLKEIEKNLVVAEIISSNFAQRQIGNSELGDYYRKLGNGALEKLQWPASSDSIVYRASNTGNGILTVVSLNKAHCLTEHWQVQLLSSNYATVVGSKTGSLGLRLKPDEQYPNPEDTGLNRKTDYGFRNVSGSPQYEDYPFQILLTEGSTAWEVYDIIEFDTYAASRRRQIVGTLGRG
jgi:hypothetical protein